MQDDQVTIEFLPAKLDINDFLPRFEYILKGREVSDEAKALKQSLVGFLELNQELLINNSGINPEDYARGVKQGVAICKLWIDSVFVSNDKQQKASE